jgi:hypothetical protein
MKANMRRVDRPAKSQTKQSNNKPAPRRFCRRPASNPHTGNLVQNPSGIKAAQAR